jgi:chromosome segregation ATPase
MKAAYAKFSRKLSKLVLMQRQATAKATKAQLTAEHERDAAQRCLDAEKMLSGPARAARSRLAATIRSAVKKANKRHQKELGATVKKWMKKVQAMKKNIKAEQDQRFKAQFSKVKNKAKNAVTKWKTRYKLQRAAVAKDRTTAGLEMKQLRGQLAEAKKAVVPVQAAIARTKKNFGPATLSKANHDNAEAVKLLRAQLKAKTKEVQACRTAIHTGVGPHDLDKPCPMRMTELMSKLKTMKANKEEFQEQATKDDSKYVSTKVSLTAAKERIAELEKQLQEHKHQNEQMQAKIQQMQARHP